MLEGHGDIVGTLRDTGTAGNIGTPAGHGDILGTPGDTQGTWGHSEDMGSLGGYGDIMGTPRAHGDTWGARGYSANGDTLGIPGGAQGRCGDTQGCGDTQRRGDTQEDRGTWDTHGHGDTRGYRDIQGTWGHPEGQRDLGTPRGPWMAQDSVGGHTGPYWDSLATVDSGGSAVGTLGSLGGDAAQGGRGSTGPYWCVLVYTGAYWAHRPWRAAVESDQALEAERRLSGMEPSSMPRAKRHLPGGHGGRWGHGGHWGHGVMWGTWGTPGEMGMWGTLGTRGDIGTRGGRGGGIHGAHGGCTSLLSCRPPTQPL